MGNVGVTNRKIEGSGTTVSPRGLMGSLVTCPGWGKTDKRGCPRVPTHHPLVFQNQQT